MGSKKRPKRPRQRRGPKKFPDRVLLPLAPGVLERIEDARGEHETRVDLIREGIERVLQERDK